MEGPEGEEDTPPDDRRILSRLESGEEWVVTVGGLSASGILPLRSVPIIEIHFTRLGAQDVPVRRVLCRGGSLEEFQDEDLAAAFQISEPIPQPAEEPPPESRPKRGKGRRGRKS
jgi:hypothetical protein